MGCVLAPSAAFRDSERVKCLEEAAGRGSAAVTPSLKENSRSRTGTRAACMLRLIGALFGTEAKMLGSKTGGGEELGELIGERGRGSGEALFWGGGLVRLVHRPPAGWELGESKEDQTEGDGCVGEEKEDQNSGQNGRTETGAGDQIVALAAEGLETIGLGGGS